MIMVLSYAVAKQFDLETLKIAAADKVENMYYRSDNARDKLAVIDKAILDGWASDRLYLVQGKVFEDIGNHTKATESFSIAMQQSNYKYEVCEEIISFYYEDKKYENAINVLNQYMNKVQTDNSSDTKMIKNLSDLSIVLKIAALYTEGEYDSAMRELIEYDNKMSIEGVESISNFFLDTCYSEEKNISEGWITSESRYKTTKSYQFLSECISEVSNCSLAYLLMFHIDIENEDYTTAISNAKKALALNPLFVDLNESLLWLSLELDDYESAYESYQLLMLSESSDLLRLQKAYISIDDSYAYGYIIKPAEEVPWEHGLEDTTEEVVRSEFDNELILFYNWITMHHPEDKHANWLHARALAKYDAYDSRMLLQNVNYQSVYDKSLIAYTYYLDHDYQTALSMLEQISSTDAINLVFEKYDLIHIYSECGLFDSVIDILDDYDYYPSSLIISESPYLQNNPNAVFTLLDAFHNHIVDTAPNKALKLQEFSDEIAYTFISRLYNKLDAKKKLMSYIYSKNAITYVNLLVEMGQETQAKEIIKSITLSKNGSLYGELMDWGNYYKDVKQYSEAISYYNLAHYIYDHASHPVLKTVECYYKNDNKKEAKETLLSLDLADEEGYIIVYELFSESPEMILECYDWVNENLGYYYAVAYELYKMGEYSKAAEYIEYKSQMDEYDLGIYYPAKKIASNPDWKPFVNKDGYPFEADDSVVMYHPETIKHDQNSITVWIKFLKTKEVDNSYDYVESKELWMVDVSNKQYKLIQGIVYFKGGNRKDITPSTEWEYPIPDTIGYDIVAELVKKHKKLRAGL